MVGNICSDDAIVLGGVVVVVIFCDGFVRVTIILHHKYDGDGGCIRVLVWVEDASIIIMENNICDGGKFFVLCTGCLGIFLGST